MKPEKSPKKAKPFWSLLDTKYFGNKCGFLLLNKGAKGCNISIAKLKNYNLNCE